MYIKSMLQIKRVSKYSILLLTLLFFQKIDSKEVSDLKATWSGIEVFGVNKIEAQKIRELVPISIGSSFFLSEKEKYLSMCCNIIKQKMKIEDIKCSLVFFGNDQAFLDIEAISPGIKKHKFRIIPKKQGSIAKLPKKLNLLYDQWDKRMYYLISNGKPFAENYSKGYLDFDEPILHRLSIEMTKYAYTNNDKLLDIIRYSVSVRPTTCC